MHVWQCNFSVTTYKHNIAVMGKSKSWLSNVVAKRQTLDVIWFVIWPVQFKLTAMVMEMTINWNKSNPLTVTEKFH